MALSGLSGISAINAAASSLIASLVAYWRLGEASGARVDLVSAMSLTDNNTVTQATGKVGDAAQFTAANSEWLSIADNTTLSSGNIDFTIACWVYLDSKPSLCGIVGKWTITGNQQEYLISYVGGGTDRFFFVASSAGNNQTNRQASTFGAPSTGTWYLIVAWHDAAADTVNIQINNGTVDTTTGYTGGLFDSTAEFTVGRYNGTNYWDGRIDEVGIWKRVLTTNERTLLYNGGAGRTWPFDGT